MSWIILRTTSGERFLCQTEANLADAISNRKAIQIKNVYSVVTISIMGPMGPSRMTTLEYPDLQNEEPLESMFVLPSAWYPFPDEKAEEELKELRDSMAKAKEFREEMEKQAREGSSGIVQARLQPTFPGGGGPLLGSLAGGMKPPGLR